VGQRNLRRLDLWLTAPSTPTVFDNLPIPPAVKEQMAAKKIFAAKFKTLRY
jgi:hypothetical protein